MAREARYGRGGERGRGRSRGSRSAETGGRSGSRGQTHVVGIVLLVGVVTVGCIGIITLGSVVLDTQQRAVETEHAERSMLEFAHTVETTAADGRVPSDVATGRFDHGRAELRTDAGRLTVAHVNDSGATDVLYDESLGTFAYVDGDTEIAYQGGGVWRSDGTGATTVSSPGIEYREGTVTFPIYRLTGDRVSTDAVDGTVRRAADPTAVEPADRSVGALEGGSIRIDLESDYCEAWEREFEATLDGGVTERCTENRPQHLRVELPIHPGPGAYDSAVIAETIDAGFEAKRTQIEGDVRANDVEEWLYDGNRSDEGYDFPSSDDRVAEKIEQCDGEFEELDEEPDDPGTYCVDELTEGHEFDTTDGDIDVVVRDSIELSGKRALLAEGDNDLTFYVGGDVSIEGNNRIGNESDPAQTRFVVSSDGRVLTGGSGNPEIWALVYAPDSTVTLQGNPTIVGSIVGDRVAVENNLDSGGIRYDERLESVGFVPSGKPEARYAAITAYEIEFDG